MAQIAFLPATLGARMVRVLPLWQELSAVSAAIAFNATVTLGFDLRGIEDITTPNNAYPGMVTSPTQQIGAYGWFLHAFVFPKGDGTSTDGRLEISEMIDISGTPALVRAGPQFNLPVGTLFTLSPAYAISGQGVQILLRNISPAGGNINFEYHVSIRSARD